MTCDPTIATCLPLNPAMNASVFDFNAVPASNMCLANPAASDVFAMNPAPVLPNALPPGVTSLFANRPQTCQAGAALPPANVDLSLADYRSELPPTVLAAIDPVLRLQAEFNIPISFRIVNVQLSTGETVPQMYFFRTGDTPSASSMRGGGGGGLGPTTPGPPPTSLGLTVSLVGTSLGIVAFDRLLLQSLIDNHLMPAEARLPVVFGSAMTAHFALNRAGLIDSTPVQGLRAMPTLFGFQILANALLERLGARADSPATAFGSLALSLMPMYLARTSPMLAEALAAVNAGESITLASLGEMGAGAASLRLGAAFARILGWIGIIDLGARAGLWGVGRIVAATSSGDYDQNLRLWTLVRMTQDIYNQERYGWAIGGALGSFISAADSIDSALSSNYERNYTANLERIQDQLVSGSDDLGNALHRAILQIITRNTTTTQDGTATVDWNGAFREIREFYQRDENATNIRRGYSLVDDATAPLTSSGISSLIGVVDDRGNVGNPQAFREYIGRYVHLRHLDIQRTLATRSLALGLTEDVGGVRVSRVPVDPEGRAAFIAAMSPAQSEFVNGEGQRMAMEAVMLTLLDGALHR